MGGWVTHDIWTFGVSNTMMASPRCSGTVNRPYSDCTVARGLPAQSQEFCWPRQQASTSHRLWFRIHYRNGQESAFKVHFWHFLYVPEARRVKRWEVPTGGNCSAIGLSTRLQMLYHSSESTAEVFGKINKQSKIFNISYTAKQFTDCTQHTINK